MIVEIVDSLTDLEALRPEWDRLFAEVPDANVFCHSAWIWHWLDLTRDEPLILVVRSGPDRGVVGIFPLCIRLQSLAGIRFRALCHAAGGMADFSGFVISQQESAARVVRAAVEALLVKEARREWDIYHVQNLSDADLSASLFRNMLQDQTHTASVCEVVTPVVELRKPFGAAKVLREIRRRGRKLSKNVDLQVVISAPLDAARLTEFRDCHALTFPGIGFNSERGQALIMRLCADESFRLLVDFSYMLADTRIAAGHFGFCNGARAYYYVPAFDQRLAAYGPGQLLLGELIEHHRARGGSRFELLRGMERYKHDWLNRIDSNWTLFGTPLSAPRMRKLIANAWLMRRSVPGAKVIAPRQTPVAFGGRDRPSDGTGAPAGRRPSRVDW